MSDVHYYAGYEVGSGGAMCACGNPDCTDPRSKTPRRIMLDHLTPAELAIRGAVLQVEQMDADVRLTDAVVLLGAAQDSVADYLDKVDKRRFVSTSPTPPREPEREKGAFVSACALIARFAQHRAPCPVAADIESKEQCTCGLDSTWDGVLQTGFRQWKLADAEMGLGSKYETAPASAQPVAKRRERFRGPLYLFVDGDCRVYYCMDDGELRETNGDDVPENFFGHVEGFARFVGTIHQSQDWTPEQCDAAGIPHEAAHYGDWWQGHMEPATLAEVADVFDLTTAAVPGTEAEDDEEEREVCEASTPENPCGPVVTHDREGVPLCAGCAATLDRETLDEIAKLVGFDADKHDDLASVVRERLLAAAPAQPVAWDMSGDLESIALTLDFYAAGGEVDEFVAREHAVHLRRIAQRITTPAAAPAQPVAWEGVRDALMDVVHDAIHDAIEEKVECDRVKNDVLGAMRAYVHSTPTAAPEACAKCAATDAVIDGYVHAVKQAQAIEAESDAVDDEDRTQVCAIVGYWHDKLLAHAAAAPGTEADDDEEEREVCESNDPSNPCGPVVTHDGEGIPLCAECAASLDREVLDEIAKLVRYNDNIHRDLIDAVRAFAAATRPCPHCAARGGEGAVALIAAERTRQREIEGWTDSHDDHHDNEEALGLAAACYALPEGYGGRSLGSTLEVPDFWPWDAEWWKPTPNDRIRELVKAGALIVAEIERLQRAALRAAHAPAPEVQKCEKIPHTFGGFLHDESYDGPYDVDGVTYCGRCHSFDCAWMRTASATAEGSGRE